MKNATAWYIFGRQAHRNLPPLVLRLIVLRRGKQEIYLLTNVFDAQRLSRRRCKCVVRNALGRGGVLSFVQADALPASPVEPHAGDLPGGVSVDDAGLVAAGLADGDSDRGEKDGPVGLVGCPGPECGALRDASDAPADALAADSSATWHQPSRTGISVRGPKAARDYPRKKREKPPGPPKIQSASPKEVQLATQLREKIPHRRLNGVGVPPN